MGDTDSQYDVFVSAKSEDYPHATVAAKFLQDAGLRVFFSLQELPNLGNSDYFSAIDEALECSRHLLVVTSSRENVSSRWVKKEWQTFLNEKLSGRKTGNVVTLLFDKMTIGDLPLSLRQHEARLSGDMAGILAYFKPPAAPKPAPARAAKSGEPHVVFISHATKDQEAADAACAWLEGHGLRCWIAPRDVPSNKVWAGASVEAIRSARIMVLIFSSNANASQQVMREVELGVNTGLTVVPVKIEDVAPKPDFKYFLGQNRWHDAFTPPLESHFEGLAANVRGLLK